MAMQRCRFGPINKNKIVQLCRKDLISGIGEIIGQQLVWMQICIRLTLIL
jgi:hypothetical protein